MHRREFLKRAAMLSAGGLLSACSSAIVDPPKEIQAEFTATPSATIEVAEAPQAIQPEQLRVIILADGLEFPEGPAFDPQGGVWCTELGAGNLVRWQDGELTRYATGGSPNGLAFDRLGRAWFPDSKQNAIRRSILRMKFGMLFWIKLTVKLY